MLDSTSCAVAHPIGGPQAQIPLALFEPHELAIWQEDLLRRAKEGEKRRANRKPARLVCDPGPDLFDEIDPAWLNEPIAGGLGNELNVDHGAAPLLEADEALSEQAPAWSDDSVAHLHEAILLYSLRALNARGNGEEKREILRWIYAPTPMFIRFTDDEGSERLQALPQVLVPFSYERCCRLAAYNPDELREQLTWPLARLGLRRFFERQV